MNKDKEPINSKNQYHGYQEWYYMDKLYYRGKYKNNERIRYEERHGLKETKYYIR